MKKVFVIASVGMLMFATSCKKSYSCTCQDAFFSSEYTKISKTAATAAKLSCETSFANCTWSKK